MFQLFGKRGHSAEKNPKDTIKDLIYGGYSTVSIGYIGLSEVSQLVYGTDFSQDEEVYEKTFLKILKHMADKVAEFKKKLILVLLFMEHQVNHFAIVFCKIDKEEFGLVKGITDKGYYDNSFHVLFLDIKVNPFEKLRMEAPGHKYSWGGHISYIETDSLKNNLEAVYEILKYAKAVGIHYMGINQQLLINVTNVDIQENFLATDKMVLRVHNVEIMTVLK